VLGIGVDLLASLSPTQRSNRLELLDAIDAA
jgi:hypothetical protein